MKAFENLRPFEGRDSSQNGEDGIIRKIFGEIGVTNRVFVEFGCGDGTECNAAHLLEHGWTGLLMDPAGVSNNPRASVQKEFVTAGNIQELLIKHQVPPSFDLLSIDIDGNDYWVWKAITYKPRVVVIEYNAHVPAEIRATIPYDPEFRWGGKDFFGASLRALKELGEHKGYELIYCESRGVNAFFVEKNLLLDDYSPRTIESIYRPPNYDGNGARHPHDALRVMVDPGVLPSPPGLFAPPA